MASVIRIVFSRQSAVEKRISGLRRFRISREIILEVNSTAMQTQVSEKIQAAALEELIPVKSSRNFFPNTVWIMK